MRLGIVGHAAEKFTAETEEKARKAIRGAIKSLKATEVISGACPMGGIDIWAVEEALRLQIPTTEFPPKVNNWSGKGGFKDRNIKIAEFSDVVISFCVKDLPPGYTGMVFKQCYHCGTNDHIKSGGCWTAKRARQLGKTGYTVII